MNVFLRPKNIIVVGGAGGIGFAAVRRLLEGGAKNVVIASRSVQKLEEARKKLIAQFGEKVSSHVFDISDVKTQEAQREAIHKAHRTCLREIFVRERRRAELCRARRRRDGNDGVSQRVYGRDPSGKTVERFIDQEDNPSRGDR